MRLPSHIVLATENPGKAAELRAMVTAWGPVQVTTLADHPRVVLPPEDGATYAEIAEAKARTVAAALNLPALGDDSGLEVDALAGAPGLRSARWAATDAERIAKLLAALAGVADRRARFRCAMVLAWSEGRVEIAEGVCAGRIADAPIGAGGFGYDPVFVSDDLGVSFAVAPAADKARVSHRARAADALGRRLRDG
jgi:XTP/dITP diphosphohydrolase